MRLSRNIPAAILVWAGVWAGVRAGDETTANTDPAATETAAATEISGTADSGSAGPPRGNAPESRRSGRSRRGGMMPGFDFREMGSSLKEKYPEEYAEIETLRETDPRAAMEKFRRLAEKAGITMPSPNTDNGGMSSRSDRKTTAAVDRNFRRRRMKRVNGELERRYPDEFRQLQTMRDADPEGARYYFVELAARLPKETVPATSVSEHGMSRAVYTMSTTTAASSADTGFMPGPGGGMPPGGAPANGNFPTPGGSPAGGAPEGDPPGGGAPPPDVGNNDNGSGPDWQMDFGGF